MNAIEKFEIGVVLVIDNEKLEKDIAKRISATEKPVKVIKVPKSSGISTNWQNQDEADKVLFNEYRDYFHGKHYEVFSKNEQKREELGLVEQAVRFELDP